MRKAGLAMAAIAGAMVVGGCSSGGGGSSLAMEDLEHAGRTCPVDLAGAVDGDGKVTVEVDTGSGTGGDDASALDRAGGTLVTCTVTAGDGDVVAYLFGSKHEDAVGLLLPQINADLDIGLDNLPKVVQRYEDTDNGELIDIPGGGPGAVAAVDVEDATSGVLYVFAEGQSSAQARQIAERLLSRA